MSMADLVEKAHASLERVAKWRAVFCGWQLGTRPYDDPEAQAVRDHRELSILLRVEVSAMSSLLVEKGIFTAEELTIACGKEAELLSKDYERKFPGLSASDVGIRMAMPEAAETMKHWRP